MSQPTPSWDLIATFLAVARTGSLSAASRALGLSQPTARRHIEALEQQLGVVLFTRSVAGLRATDAAARITALAEAMAVNADALVRSASAGADGVSGVVRVACSEILGSEVLPPILAGVRARYPGLIFEIVPSNRQEDILRRDADIAIRMTRPTQPGLIARKLADAALGLFAAPDYIHHWGAPTTMAALIADHTLIGQDRLQDMALALAPLTAADRPPMTHYRSDSDLAQLAAVRAGVGIGVCQTRIAARHGLHRVLADHHFALEVWAVTHEDIRRTPRIRAVWDMLADGIIDFYGPVRSGTAPDHGN